MTEQFWHGWAVCHDYIGVAGATVRRTRGEAVKAFLELVEPEGERTVNAWRRYKRRCWRVSHVEFQEMLFGRATP